MPHPYVTGNQVSFVNLDHPLLRRPRPLRSWRYASRGMTKKGMGPSSRARQINFPVS